MTNIKKLILIPLIAGLLFISACENPSKYVEQGAVYLDQGKLDNALESFSKAIELNPNQALAKHNRPVDEELVQITGSSTIKLFDGDKVIKEVIIKENERFIIPANQYHIHANPNNKKSITLWQFTGDIVKVIEEIRTNFKKIL